MKFASTADMVAAFDRNFEGAVLDVARHFDVSPDYVRYYVKHLLDGYRNNDMAYVYLEAELGLYLRTRDYVRGVEHQLSLSLAGLDIVDVGCSSGHSLRAYKEMGAARVVGLEFHPGRVASCRFYLETHGTDARVVEGSILDPETVSACGSDFDLVTCFDVLEHVPSIEGAIAAFPKLLRPGGAVIATHGNRYCPANMLSEPHYGLPGMTLLPHEEGRVYFEQVRQGDYEVFHWATRKDLLEAFERNGFSVVPERVPSRPGVFKDLGAAVERLRRESFPTPAVKDAVNRALDRVEELKGSVRDPEDFFGTNTFTIFARMPDR